MNRARKGAEVERKARRWLESHGWYVVRSARSGGLWDLVAFSLLGGAVVVQVRANRWPRKKEMGRLRAWVAEFASMSSSTRAVVVRWDDRAREPLAMLLPRDGAHAAVREMNKWRP